MQSNETNRQVNKNLGGPNNELNSFNEKISLNVPIYISQKQDRSVNPKNLENNLDTSKDDLNDRDCNDNSQDYDRFGNDYAISEENNLNKNNEETGNKNAIENLKEESKNKDQICKGGVNNDNSEDNDRSQHYYAKSEVINTNLNNKQKEIGIEKEESKNKSLNNTYDNLKTQQIDHSNSKLYEIFEKRISVLENRLSKYDKEKNEINFNKIFDDNYESKNNDFKEYMDGKMSKFKVEITNNLQTISDKLNFYHTIYNFNEEKKELEKQLESVRLTVHTNQSKIDSFHKFIQSFETFSVEYVYDKEVFLKQYESILNLEKKLYSISDNSTIAKFNDIYSQLKDLKKSDEDHSYRIYELEQRSKNNSNSLYECKKTVTSLENQLIGMTKEIQIYSESTNKKMNENLENRKLIENQIKNINDKIFKIEENVKNNCVNIKVYNETLNNFLNENIKFENDISNLKTKFKNEISNLINQYGNDISNLNYKFKNISGLETKFLNEITNLNNKLKKIDNLENLVEQNNHGFKKYIEILSIKIDGGKLLKNYSSQLEQILGPSKQLINLYIASNNNYLSYSFHEAARNRSNLLSIIRTNNNCLFGFYTSKTFDPQGSYHKKYISDKNAFIFTLLVDNKLVLEKYPIDINNYQSAIFTDDNIFFALGEGYDLYIPNKCNEELSNANFPNTYMNFSSLRKNSFILGAEQFKIDELELYYISN